MGQMLESFLKDDPEELKHTGTTVLLVRSLCNGFIASVVFFIFLYFVVRYIIKFAAEEEDMLEKKAEEGFCCEFPPTYEEAMNGRQRY